MSDPLKFMRLLGLSLALYSFPGCAGELIRLGDGAAGASTFGGTAGAGGALGNAGGTTAGGGTASAGDTSAVAGSAGSPAPCTHGQVSANQVLWIGDSWITIPGTQYTAVRDRARSSGAIGRSEDYVNLAAAAASMDDVAKQYETQESGPNKVRVLIMDGGTWDGIAAQQSGGSVPDAVANAEARFQQFISRVASDGTVEHIIYFLVPALPSIPAVDSLRPVVAAACANSAVPCYFIDLQDAWADHPEYTGPSGIQASDAGAAVIADLIWSTMQDHCIAQ